MRWMHVVFACAIALLPSVCTAQCVGITNTEPQLLCPIDPESETIDMNGYYYLDTDYSAICGWPVFYRGLGESKDTRCCFTLNVSEWQLLLEGTCMWMKQSWPLDVVDGDLEWIEGWGWAEGPLPRASTPTFPDYNATSFQNTSAVPDGSDFNGRYYLMNAGPPTFAWDPWPWWENNSGCTLVIRPNAGWALYNSGGQLRYESQGPTWPPNDGPWYGSTDPDDRTGEINIYTP